MVVLSFIDLVKIFLFTCTCCLLSVHHVDIYGALYFILSIPLYTV